MIEPAMTTNAPHNDGTHTSLSQLFGQTINGTQVKAIEIPLFQRDYAQGRQSEQARHVRERFIADLCSALDTNECVHLDFVFGDVVDKEHGAQKVPTLYPLDGQQRLTTLFLLHCILAWHLPEAEGVTQPWHAFHYATRPGARAFCQFLTKCRPDMWAQKLSEWLRDQADYLPTWKHDPSIQGMLVVLDELHSRYRGQPTERLRLAWGRLTDPEKPAIRFLLLPVAAQKLDNTLYIKMNSRGRPLTAFENFKAELEALLHRNQGIPAASVADFSRKIDTDWADLFWEYRGENDLIDEEFMRYLRFLFEVRAWGRGIFVNTRHNDLQALSILADSLLGNAASDAPEDFAWIVRALNVWLTVESSGLKGAKAIRPMFSELFTRDASSATTPLRIFNFGEFGEAPVGVDLFHACCALYGTRPWSLAQTVLLYGVLQGLMNGLPQQDLEPRLRLLRNLIEASDDEIRADNTRNNMPALLREVEVIMSTGSLTDLKGITTFNQVQVRNEQAKQALVGAQPTLVDALHRLEDHELLRGGLTAFDLDPVQNAANFIQRAAQYFKLFDAPYSLVCGALLAKLHDGRGHERGSGHRLVYLGAPRQRQAGLWEDHWRARRSEGKHPSTTALANLLDDMAAGQSPRSVIDAFLGASSTPKDWRYYITKYEVMRGEHLEFAGSYVLAPYPGYSICMPKSDSCDNRSNHHDAYLLALVEAAEIAPERIGNDGWPRCFPGYETEARYLVLQESGLKVRCIENGWLWDTTGLNGEKLISFAQIVSQFGTQCIPGASFEWITTVAQQNGIDLEDRIQRGSEIMKSLINAGM